MNIEKTREYYKNPEVCSCEYCKNFVSHVRAEYPEFSKYLESIGIDAEKPHECAPLYLENGVYHYALVQYVVIGSGEGFAPESIGGVEMRITDSHPTVDTDDEFFVIETGMMALPWTGGDDEEDIGNTVKANSLFSKTIRKIKKNEKTHKRRDTDRA